MKPGPMDCPVCHGQGLAYDYRRGEWGPEKCKACGGSGRFNSAVDPDEMAETRGKVGPPETSGQDEPPRFIPTGKTRADHPFHRFQYKTKKEPNMANKGRVLIPWMPEEVDHLVSFGVQVHCEKYPHRTPKAAGLRLLKERGRLGTRQPIKAGNVLIGTVERPIVTVLPSADCPGENNAIVPPERPVNTEHGLVTPEPVPLVRIGLPISLSILGPMLQVIGDSTSGATVRQVGSELWIEAPQ